MFTFFIIRLTAGSVHAETEVTTWWALKSGCLFLTISIDGHWGGRDLRRCYQRGKLLKLSLISDIKLSAPVKVRYLQTSKGQKWNLNIAFLLEHNTNKKNRTERADLFLSIVLLHHEKSLRSLNVEFEQSLTPGLCHNATANWNNRLLSWGVKRSSEVENITSESGCTDFLFLYLYDSKVVAMWLNASVCSDLFDFLIGTYVSYISFLNLQSVCCLSFFNWPVCPSTYKHCVDLVAFTCIYICKLNQICLNLHSSESQIVHCAS